MRRWSAAHTIAIVCLANTLGFANWGATPWVIGALIDGRGLDAAAAGLLATIELVAMGLAMLAIAPFTAAMPTKHIILPALIVAIFAQGLTIVAHEYALLAIARAISGLAFAAMFTLAAVEGSRSRSPERVFAAAAIVTLTLGAGKVLLLGYAKQVSPADGVFFGLMAYYLLIGLPLFVLVRSAPPAPPLDTAQRLQAATLTRPALGVAISALAIMGLYSFATGGVFAFTQQVGTSVGLSSAELGRGTATIGLLGVFGGLAAERLGIRLGRLPPTVGALILTGIVCLLVMLAPTRAGYWIAMTAWILTYWFSYPYIMGLAAHFDRRGSLAAGMAAVMILTSAAGTAISGVLNRLFGPASFGWVALAICWCAALLATWLLIGDHHRSRSADAGRPFASALD